MAYKIANQSDIDNFIQIVQFNKEIYPYLSGVRFVEWKEFKSDWEGIYVTDLTLSFMVKASFDRCRDLEINICVYARTTMAAGRAILAVKEIIHRYHPRAINSCVHASNEKAIKLNEKLMGPHWGIESKIAWNCLTGDYEDFYCFRRLFQRGETVTTA